MATYHYGAGFDVLTEDDGSVVKSHIGGLGEAVGTSGSVGTYRYFQHDDLGSVREVRDDSLNVTGEFEYTPYGGSYFALETATGVRIQSKKFMDRIAPEFPQYTQEACFATALRRTGACLG